jgi:hypothetical protein
VNSLKTTSVVALASSLLLVGCGGGGSSTVNNAATSAIVTSTVVGVDVSGQIDIDSPVLTSSVVMRSPTFSNIQSLSNFTFGDSSDSISGQYAFDTAGTSMDNLSTVWIKNNAYSLGGTKWSYARYGLFVNQMLVGTQMTARTTPFFLASTYKTSTLVDTTYGKNGLAIGLISSANGSIGVKCNASAAYNFAGNKIVLTLSACVNADNGEAVSSAGNIELNPAGNTINDFSVQPNSTTAVVNFSEVVSSDFKLAGPAGQELVGAVTVKGGSSYFTFAFGAQK